MRYIANLLGLILWCGIPTLLIAGYAYLQERVWDWPLALVLGIPMGLLALYLNIKTGGF